MNFGQKALQVLRTVAPTLALGTLGPFGPLAATAIHLALGTTDDKSAETALLTATPDQLLKLKTAENDFQLQLKQLGIEQEKLVYDDIANARGREEVVKDKTPMFLAVAITVGFFGLLAFLCVGTPPPGSMTILNIMTGALGTAWIGIVNYYFGSSSGSAAKSDTISKIAGAK